MHHVRGVADQRHARGDVRARPTDATAETSGARSRAAPCRARRRNPFPARARRLPASRPATSRRAPLAPTTRWSCARPSMAGTPACRRREIAATRCAHAGARCSPWRRWRSGRSRCAWPQARELTHARLRAIGADHEARAYPSLPRVQHHGVTLLLERGHISPATSARPRGARRRPALPATRCSPRSRRGRARRFPRHRTPAHRRHAAARRHATPACVRRVRCAWRATSAQASAARRIFSLARDSANTRRSMGSSRTDRANRECADRTPPRAQSANACLAREQNGGGEPDGPGTHHGHVVVDVHSSGRPRARRGMRPAKPQLTRDSARLAAGLRSNSSRPKLRTSRNPGRVRCRRVSRGCR